MLVTLMQCTKDPDRFITAIGKVCYSKENAPGIDKQLDNRDYIEKFVKDRIKSGHLSIVEHVFFTFAVSGVSRACTHQIVRFRLASYTQQSQRYVSFEDGCGFRIPHTLEDISHTYRCHKVLADLQDFYNSLIKAGVPAEDARYILPNAALSNIVITMNARELLHFFRMNSCRRSQWEINEVSDEMMKICKGIAPATFALAGPDCVRKECKEVHKCKNPFVGK